MQAQEIQNKIHELSSVLYFHTPFVLAFSGGLDSRFIAHIAQQAKSPFTAVHVRGPHVPQTETDYALSYLNKHSIPYTELDLNPLGLPAVAEGSKERCYQCKREMFYQILATAKGLPVLEGSNASDLTKFRPGLKVLKELNIVSPLALAKISKAEIRLLATETGLDNPNQPSRPCLLTRLDYGLYPNQSILQHIEKTEEAIAKLGFKDFRLRVEKEGKSLLQIGWDEAQLMEAKKESLVRLLSRMGFENTKIQAEIALSGYFDQAEE